ncbi:MAG: hypothetical protein ACRD4R_16145 [Candidatus Acidiferrales bacterium]
MENKGATMDGGNVDTSGTSEFSLWGLVFWAGVIVGVVLLIRFLARAGAGAPTVAAGTVAAVPFSPWFPLR